VDDDGADGAPLPPHSHKTLPRLPSRSTIQ
jgi:hypothetical protein